MNRSHLLRVLVAVDVLLAFASVGAEAFFGWTLPPALAAYDRHRLSAAPGDVAELIVLAATSLCAFAAWIGLVTFWRHARRLYVLSLAMWTLLELASGPSVRTAVGDAFASLNALVAGLILGLVYYSDLARRFEATPVAGAAHATTPFGAGNA